MTKFNVQLPVSVFKEGKHFVAFTPALDLSTSGKTHEQAMERFSEIVEIFFAEIMKKGSMEEVLLSLGWEKIKKQWNPPNLISQESKQIKLAIR
ncbi:hypothetical protein A2662_03585 [Candidatus Giovannonibacteria bacterium RIFCSPHIGHO2_01_FULL_45_33]|uniref:HicB-like antitoxin of toxin-antitoxin system domain-containing protein n=1 Tax=Candidatus Giovannonibacteria bacterium RIFCSPLOWO2_01_FULL_45_34 TaxID=1798351 RepID=A0A1F5WYJ1_9BACT|nr:MAG: hypothetical protein A2662_03585 [Candidatus Giovannonibacteria bacterium RIFCSPHIGHO2_01_FULL_45_33]OGF70898.1 MAG: hypothetical protein A3C73_04860 [Candidatus Giovannonibacteria bacterium RIFCSPHIGHO2_02_FULL_44_11]OGF80725.1 MAG: hypothetical protein A2930_03620 [Candidatus Giovannonibacteria bacterium RIFCSPLOWO2_01_FULL_45_34]